MRWADEMRIDTPEQIGLDLELAGLGSRFVAQMVDWVWKVLLSLVLGMIGAIVFALLGAANPFESPSKVLAAVLVTLLYLVWLGYGVYFEVRWNGQTPGKRFAHIRVVRLGGAPVDAVSAGVRNLLAAGDFLPSFFLLGSTLILLTANRQRLGDLAAGTIVVRERWAGEGPESEDELFKDAPPEIAFTPAQLAALDPTDRAVIRSLLQRLPGMERAGRERLAVRMAARFHRKTGFTAVPPPAEGGDARAFLASLLRDLDQFVRHG
ncbi:RDD family protein [bacterium]|nr:RDD family protein [bacterium]